MPVAVKEPDSGKLLEIHLTGKLVKENYETGMGTFCKPFTEAKVRYLDPSEAISARQWLAEN